MGVDFNNKETKIHLMELIIELCKDENVKLVNMVAENIVQEGPPRGAYRWGQEPTVETTIELHFIRHGDEPEPIFQHHKS